VLPIWRVGTVQDGWKRCTHLVDVLVRGLAPDPTRPKNTKARADVVR